MRISDVVMILCATAALAACGSQESGPAGSGAAATGGSGGSAPSNVSASAEEVAEQARGDVDCPADIRTARPAGAAVDDVVGVRPGMSYEEAANVVMCTNDLMVVTQDNSRGFNIQTYGQQLRQGFSARLAEPKIEKTSEQIMQEMQDDFMARSGNAVRPDMQPGQVKWYVGTMGMPGQEKVINAAREEWFEAGKNPTMASVEQALLGKYGTPTRRQEAGTQIYVTWAYDPMGRLVTETSPLYNQCTGNADPDGGVNLSPDCGIVVQAMVSGLRENPQLAQFMQVGVVDKAVGYELVTATEQGLQQQEEQRRAQQVQEASENASAPTL